MKRLRLKQILLRLEGLIYSIEKVQINMLGIHFIDTTRSPRRGRTSISLWQISFQVLYVIINMHLSFVIISCYQLATKLESPNRSQISKNISRWNEFVQKYFETITWEEWRYATVPWWLMKRPLIRVYCSLATILPFLRFVSAVTEHTWCTPHYEGRMRLYLCVKCLHFTFCVCRLSDKDLKQTQHRPANSFCPCRGVSNTVQTQFTRTQQTS